MDQRSLILRQVEISLDLPVLELSRATAYRNEGQISASFALAASPAASGTNSGIRGWLKKAAAGLVSFRLFRLFLGTVFLVDGFHFGVHGITGVLQTFHEGYGISLVHVAAAGASGDKIVRGGTVSRYLLDTRGQRQGIIRIL